jgi:hypothetical protein
MKTEATITINRNSSVVWNAITDIKNASQIISGIEKVEILEEPDNGLVGLKWSETRMYFGKPSAIDKWITEAVEMKYYKTRAEMEGFIFNTTFSIEEIGDTIQLRSSHETLSLGILAKIKSLPMIFFKGMLKKAILKDLMDIKTTIENT